MFRLEDLAHHLEMGVEAEHLVDGLRAEPRERRAIGEGETGIRVAEENGLGVVPEILRTESHPPASTKTVTARHPGVCRARRTCRSARP
jgi:hypothetical protein